MKGGSDLNMANIRRFTLHENRCEPLVVKDLTFVQIKMFVLVVCELKGE